MFFFFDIRAETRDGATEIDLIPTQHMPGHPGHPGVGMPEAVLKLQELEDQIAQEGKSAIDRTERAEEERQERIALAYAAMKGACLGQALITG